jgi:hypothetical protein
MGFVQLHTRDVHRTDHLAMVGLSTLGSGVLQAMHRFKIHRTNVGGLLITDAPPLTFYQPYDRVFGELAAGHQGALPFGKLGRMSQRLFDVFVLACPHRCTTSLHRDDKAMYTVDSTREASISPALASLPS